MRRCIHVLTIDDKQFAVGYRLNHLVCATATRKSVFIHRSNINKTNVSIFYFILKTISIQKYKKALCHCVILSMPFKMIEGFGWSRRLHLIVWFCQNYLFLSFETVKNNQIHYILIISAVWSNIYQQFSGLII